MGRLRREFTSVIIFDGPEVRKCHSFYRNVFAKHIRKTHYTSSWTTIYSSTVYIILVIITLL